MIFPRILDAGSSGWVIDPVFLKKIKIEIDKQQGVTQIDFEEIEMVLLALEEVEQ